MGIGVRKGPNKCHVLFQWPFTKESRFLERKGKI
jgi:hypothetical protein